MQMTLAIFGGLVAFPLLVALSATWRGYVLSILWGWFLVPLGAPVLSIPYAIGLSLIVGYLTHQSRKSEDIPGLGTQVLGVLLSPAFALLIGWIVTKFL